MLVRLPAAALAVLSVGGACSPRPRAALVPVVDELLALWEEADLVCLGEEHGSRADAEVRLALIADPRFAATVEIVLLEAASPLHQELLDRFVLAGDELDRAALRPVWLDAGLGEFWESPIYEGLLRALRRVNLARPAGERVRVVAGAAPIDWRTIEEPEDLAPFLDRRALFARRAREQVLARDLRSLAVFGAAHCLKSGAGFPAALPPDLAARVRSVLPLHAPAAAGRQRLALGPHPRLVTVADTPLAAEPAAGMLTAPADRTLGDLADALLWFGPGPDEILAPRRDELPAAWRRELDRRARLWREAHGLPLAVPAQAPGLVQRLPLRP